VNVREVLVLPIRFVLGIGRDERHIEAMIGRKVTGVGDDDADTARELQVLEKKGNAHAGRYRNRVITESPIKQIRGASEPPLRVAFVGQSTFFEACSLESQAAAAVGLESRFFEYRDASPIEPVLEELGEFGADVTVVFRPEIIPPGAFHELPGAVVGFLTEPLPRRERGQVAHKDLGVRLRDLHRVDRLNVDRVISFDPMIVAAADEAVPVWRSLPLPVADSFYRSVGAALAAPPALFVGRSTPHRERFLAASKEQGEILHLGFGVDSSHLQELMEEHSVAINVHNEPYPTFENRVCLHLAAGQLVLSEPLSPLHGLEPGIDFLECADGDVLAERLERLRQMPRLWQDVRIRGRRKAELYRASRVYPRIIFDLLADLSSAPSKRPGAALSPKAASLS